MDNLVIKIYNIIVNLLKRSKVLKMNCEFNIHFLVIE